MTGVPRRASARLGLVAATIALAAAVGGCAQSSHTTSTGAAGGAAPTSSTPASPTTPTTTSATTSAPASSGALTASPASGSPSSVIHFAFAPPADTATQGPDEVSASLSVMGSQKAGCVGIHQQPLPSLAAGQQTSVSLGPAQLGGKWCPGTYSARVEIVARPKCGQGMMCPQFIRVVATLGPASFRISG